MTIKEMQVQLQSSIKPIYGEREAATIAEWVIESVTGQKRIDRLINNNQLINTENETAINLIIKRLLTHEPIQYILGKAWFYGMELSVDKNVLIPRPETEELVSWIIETVKGWPEPTGRNYKLLDVGTGSGCMAIALKNNLPTCFEIWACDKSDAALTTARKNADNQSTLVDFLSIDFLDTMQWAQLPHADIIASNPPYIPLAGKTSMNNNVVDYEPAMALFVPDENPLVFYKALASFGKEKLQTGGLLFVEIHEDLGKNITDLFIREGYTDVECRKDMQGKDRMVRGRRLKV